MVDSASGGTLCDELLKGHGFAAVVDPFQQVLVIIEAQGGEVLHLVSFELRSV